MQATQGMDGENCQSRGRGFKSRRARHQIKHFSDGLRGLSPKYPPLGQRFWDASAPN